MLKKVNLGCGPVSKGDWINLDWGILAFLHKNPIIEKLFLKFGFLPARYKVKWPNNLKLHDLNKRLPFNANEVDYIYISHVLEHFKKFEAEKIAKECFRVLKKEGCIRVVVPDLKLLLEKYAQADKEYFKKIAKLTADTEQEKTGKDFNLADVLMDNFYPQFYREKFKGFRKILIPFIRPHCWMYDYESLKELLAQAGFSHVQKRAFRDGRVPDLEHLDVFPEMSLYVEARK
ncbi:MAG: methyltransferase domain-containing protein [Candidatus Omnitrophota bacterium]